MSSPTPGTKIYYTTNGATPAFVEENLYSKPFKAAKGVTVKAIAKKFGVDNSSIVYYKAGM